MKDEEFICSNCSYIVKPLIYTVRNHCPNCLYLKHVDINQDNRLETCFGLLKTMGIKKPRKADYQIIFRCRKCGIIKKNILVVDDNVDLIVKIANKIVKC